jgi:hypothetical protein
MRPVLVLISLKKLYSFLDMQGPTTQAASSNQASRHGCVFTLSLKQLVTVVGWKVSGVPSGAIFFYHCCLLI